MALKIRLLEKPQLEELGNTGHITEGSVSKTKFNEAFTYQLFLTSSPISPPLCPCPPILKRKYVI